MSKQIFNGGIQGGILNLIPDEELSEKDRKRKEYLNSLPKNEWIDLDENGMSISKEQAVENWQAEIDKYKPI